MLLYKISEDGCYINLIWGLSHYMSLLQKRTGEMYLPLPFFPFFPNYIFDFRKSGVVGRKWKNIDNGKPQVTAVWIWKLFYIGLSILDIYIYFSANSSLPPSPTFLNYTNELSQYRVEFLGIPLHLTPDDGVQSSLVPWDVLMCWL